MNVNCILAVDINNVIGIGNKLPWHIKEEMQHFKSITEGNTLVMGSKTFLDIFGNWPLKIPFFKNRHLIILTTDKTKFQQLFLEQLFKQFTKYSSNFVVEELDGIPPFISSLTDNNIVVHELNKTLSDLQNFDLIKQAFILNKCQGELFVAGGNQIYKMFLKYCNSLHYSTVKKDILQSCEKYEIKELVHLYEDFHKEILAFDILLNENDFTEFTYRHSLKSSV